MSLLNRFLPAASTLALLALLELSVALPRVAPWLFLAALLAVGGTYWHLGGRRVLVSNGWHLAALPALLLVSGVLTLAFTEGRWAQQGVLLATVLLYGLYTETVALFWYFRHRYQAHALENLASYLSVVAVFLFAVAAASAVTFVGLPRTLFLALVIGVAAVAAIAELRLSGGRPQAIDLSTAVATSLTGVAFFAALLLPTSVYVTATLTAVAYYVGTGLLRNWHLGIQDRTVIQRYAAIAVAVVLLTLLTAKWT